MSETMRELIAGMKARGESTGNGELVEYADKLAALASEGVAEREAVAWRFSVRGGSGHGYVEAWCYTNEEWLADAMRERGRTVEALFRTPPSHPAPEPEQPELVLWVLAWLGQWRAYIPHEGVKELQDIASDHGAEYAELERASREAERKQIEQALTGTDEEWMLDEYVKQWEAEDGNNE